MGWDVVFLRGVPRDGDALEPGDYDVVIQVEHRPTTLKVLGHEEPSPDAKHLFRRCGPIWLTFAAAHLIAEYSGHQQGIGPRDQVVGYGAWASDRAA